MARGVSPLGEERHHLRRRGAQRQDPVLRPVLLPVGHGPLPGAEIRPVRPEHGGGAAEPDGRGAAPVERDGIPVPGAADPGGGDGVPGAAAEHLLPVRRRGRGGGGTHPGGDPGGGAAGRGCSDAPLLCGAVLRPVLGPGGQAVVLLQPGGAGTLVLSGVGPEGRGAQRPLPPLHHGGQPGPVSPGAGAIPDHVPGDLLPPVRAGGMDRGGRAGI